MSLVKQNLQVRKYYHPYKWKYMDQIVQDDKVAVIISQDYGTGWYSWHNKEEMLYDPVIVKLILEYNTKQYEDPFDPRPLIQSQFENYVFDEYSIKGCNIEDFSVEWIEIGKEFIIEEYDGVESIKLKEDFKWLKA